MFEHGSHRPPPRDAAREHRTGNAHAQRPSRVLPNRVVAPGAPGALQSPAPYRLGGKDPMTSHHVWAVIVSLALLSVAAPVAAQNSDVEQTKTEVKPDFKGTIGLGMIGAELGFVIPALAGAKGVWPYIVFPVAGAAGGAVAGYFLLEKGDGHPELAVATLTVGMALAIPALVATVAATAYRPPERIETAKGGPGLVRYAGGSLRLAPPAIATGPTITARQALRTGERRVSSLRVAMLSAQF